MARVAHPRHHAGRHVHPELAADREHRRRRVPPELARPPLLARHRSRHRRQRPDAPLLRADADGGPDRQCRRVRRRWRGRRRRLRRRQRRGDDGSRARPRSRLLSCTVQPHRRGSERPELPAYEPYDSPNNRRASIGEYGYDVTTDSDPVAGHDGRLHVLLPQHLGLALPLRAARPQLAARPAGPARAARHAATLRRRGPGEVAARPARAAVEWLRASRRARGDHRHRRADPR